MAVPTYRAANFQDNLTLNMPGGTGTGTSTWTLNQATTSLPSGAFRALVYESVGTFVTTREIVTCTVTGANTVAVSVRNAEGDTPAVNHINGSIFAVVNTAGMENAQNDAITDLYSSLAGTVTVTSGEAFSIRDALYIKASDGRAYKTLNTAFEAGNVYTPLFAAAAASGAAQSVLAYTPGRYIGGFSGLTVGVPYYPGTTGNITTTKGAFGRVLGFAVSATVFCFEPEDVEKNQIVETVIAGGNWVDGQMLYQKKSDTRWYVMDTTIAESGVCEVWGFAVVTHTGGAGSTQKVYLQGSVINTPAFFVSGATYYSTTSGSAYTANAIPGVDQFYRQVCYALSTTRIQVAGDQTFFLPTGIQEKGYCGMGVYTDGSFGKTYTSVHNFVKKMVNTPSSLTLTVVNQAYINSVTAASITRFGFRLDIVPIAVGRSFWEGTYVTVGN